MKFQLFYLPAEPTITALEVRRQKEKELRENDLYWQKRLKEQEQTMQRTNLILEQEYNETVPISLFIS